jgi:heme-degrading monooxygenase HmoA
MSLLPEDRDSAVILTLWQDEESLKASEKGVFAEANRKVSDLLEKPPASKKFRVYSTELFQHIENTSII